MSTVFADTSYFVALLNPRDDQHAAVRLWTANFEGRLLTTAWVLVEAANFMSRGANRRAVLELLKQLRRDESVTIVPPLAEDYEQGLALFSQRLDKDWSLTDCISFVIMQREGLTEAATADAHFRQAGFRTVLR